MKTESIKTIKLDGKPVATATYVVESWYEDHGERLSDWALTELEYLEECSPEITKQVREIAEEGPAE